MNAQEKELWRQKFLAALEDFRLLDDEFMTVVFQESPECVDLVLQIILDKPNLKTTKVTTQDTIKNLHGRSLRLDIHAFADGQEFNIEIQRAESGALERRARYHSSLMDAGCLLPGENYAALPESYVIFITEADVLGYGASIYVIQRTIQGRQDIFNDGSHIVYVNSSVTGKDTALGRLMHDFRCARPEEMYHDVLAERVRYFKETEKGAEPMGRVMDAFINEMKDGWLQEGIERGMERGMEQGRAQGREEGKETERIFSIRTLMKNLGITAEKAMDALSVPASERGRYKAMLQE